MRLRALDLFCCQGGVTAGYQAAGFEVTGVDIEPQPRYIGDHFVQGDALDFVARHGHEFDVITASPPCDAYTRLAAQHGTADSHPRLIEPTRELLRASGRPYVIENVETARPHLVDPIMLCGEMFGLTLFRHRLFESGGGLVLHQPPHYPHRGRIGSGGYVTMTGSSGGRSVRDGIQHGRKEDWVRASGIGWMTVAGLREAIPPAFSEFLGRQVMAQIDPDHPRSVAP